MLEKFHIEGLEAHEDHELYDDTPPTAVQVWFDVVLEEMPYLSDQAGRIIKKPFVHRFVRAELGRFESHRRVRDNVELNEATGKWVVKRLATPKQSDILKFKDAWNHFMRGTTIESTGTPLSVLFRNDPGRVDLYKMHHIVTVEQLAQVPEVQAQELGMGARAEIERAKAYLSQSSETGAVTRVNRELEEERAARKALEATVQDLTEKLTELLTKDVDADAPKRRGRAKVEIQSEA